jgi:NAD(P) transhydrogenase alpha subunit
VIVGIPREAKARETRVAATPATVTKLVELGYQVVVESGAGGASSFLDAAYVEAGARVASAQAAWASDVVLKVNAPSREEIALLLDGTTLVSLLSPALNPDLVEALAERPITVLAMDAVPRISRAQSLDVLSSMANIAGYRAVIEAAHTFGRFFTGQVTAAGKVPPAKVLVVGAGPQGCAGGSNGHFAKAKTEAGRHVRTVTGACGEIPPGNRRVSGSSPLGGATKALDQRRR